MSTSANASAPSLNNPAARLLDFTEKTKNRAAIIPGHENPSVEIIFYEMFDVPSGDRSSLLPVIAPLFKLPRQIRDAVVRHDDLSHELLLQWLPGVEQVLGSFHLSEQFRQFATRFNETTIYGMSLCADFLSRRAGEKVLATEEVAKIAADVASIKESVTKSKISNELKRFIFIHLDAIEVAVREYRLSGTVPLEQALNAAVGSALADPKLAEQTRNDTEGKKLWALLGRIHVLLGSTWTTMQIGESAGKTIAQLIG